MREGGRMAMGEAEAQYRCPSGRALKLLKRFQGTWILRGTSIPMEGACRLVLRHLRGAEKGPAAGDKMMGEGGVGGPGIAREGLKTFRETLSTDSTSAPAEIRNSTMSTCPY